MREKHYTEADWRCHIVVRLSAPAILPGNKTPSPAGTIGKGVAMIDYQGNQVAFSIPNATALFLNLSKRHYESAHETAQTFSSAPKLKSLSDIDIFSYLEDMMASITFAYTSLESFANEEIPDDFIYEISQKKYTEVYNKPQIERSLNLRVKLGDILPNAHKIPSPKGIKVWQDFIYLEELRNSIIHMKTADREANNYSAQSIWSKLINEPVPYVVPIVKAMIDHFYAARAIKPYWYQHLPF